MPARSGAVPLGEVPDISRTPECKSSTQGEAPAANAGAADPASMTKTSAAAGIEL
jgi:hypothetical protein